MAYIDDRSKNLLTAIVNYPAITGKDLQEKLGLSRKQLSYTMDKVNDYLIENGLPKIERHKTGKITIPVSVIERFREDDISYQGIEYVFSDIERRNIIILILLIHNEELSSYDFIQKLRISKNTLSLDLRKLQNSLQAEYDLNILYNRKSGYDLVGGEYAKRELMISSIRKMLNIPNGQKILSNVCDIDENKIIELRKDIIEIEHKLGIRFTDERLVELPYILYSIVKRIHSNQLLDVMPVAYQHIIGTKEYSATSNFIDKYKIENQHERMFLSAQIQISNLHYLRSDEYRTEMKLMKAADAMIDNFEEICCIKIKDREALLEALIQHCQPAFYRIKYQYHLENSILNMVLPQHNFLHEMVRRSIIPLESLLNHEIPDEELVYITVLFGAWLKKEGSLEVIEEKKKAVIVCTNGISISNFLFITLQETFPEIDFLTCLSIRDFYEYDKEYDLVFTTVRLEYKVPQFLVTPFIDENSRQKFRQMVLHEIEGINLYRIQVSSILGIIEKHARIDDRDGLVDALNSYMNNDKERDVVEKKLSNRYIKDNNPQLNDLLTSSTVMISEEKLHWHNAIKTASIPLLQNGSIEESYVDKMISLIEVKKPFILIAKGVIIAHAGIEDGVNTVAMSLLRLPNQISINGYMEADIIIVLGTPNKTSHLTALYKLIEITESDSKMNLIRQTDKITDIVSIIKNK